MKLDNSTRTNEFLLYLKSKTLTRKSIESCIKAITMYWNWLDKENLEAEEVSYNDLLLYMRYKGTKGASQRTIQNYVGMIKHYYEHLLCEGKVAINPAIDIEVKGVKRKILYQILEAHELHQLYNKYLNRTVWDRRNKVILGLLINQGLKTEELGKLEVKDIDLREGKIDVPGGFKSNSREMKLEAHQVMSMYDYVQITRDKLLEMNPKRKSQAKQKTEKLFIGEGGTCYNFNNMMTHLMLNVRELNPIVLNAKHIRASVITKWLKMYNLREVQYLAGHRYISSTESYLENDMEGLQEEVNQFHPLG